VVGTIRITVNDAPVRRLLDRAPRVVFREIEDVFRDVGAFHTRTIQKDQFSRYRPTAYPRKLRTRTGGLRNSFGFRVTGRGTARPGLSMFSTSRIARWQEDGATVRAKRAQYLTVPTQAALTGSGALSGRVRIRRGGARSHTTDLGDTFIFKAKSGQLYIGIKGQKAPSGAPRAFYALKKSITYPPRLGFKRTFESKTRPFMNRRMRAGAVSIERKLGGLA